MKQTLGVMALIILFDIQSKKRKKDKNDPLRQLLVVIKKL